MQNLFTLLNFLSPMQLAIMLGAVSAGVGSGMMVVFSTGVMQGLGQLSSSEAVRAMQAINVAVINPMFLSVFMGTGVYALILAMMNLFGSSATNPWLLAGAVVYMVGVVFVTIGGNVPLNDALATINADGAGPETWTRYARPWLLWNHLRAAAGSLAALLLILAALN